MAEEGRLFGCGSRTKVNHLDSLHHGLLESPRHFLHHGIPLLPEKVFGTFVFASVGIAIMLHTGVAWRAYGLAIVKNQAVLESWSAGMLLRHFLLFALPILCGPADTE